MEIWSYANSLSGGHLSVIAGRPAMGKTFFGLRYAYAVSRWKKGPVFIFSPIMSAANIFAKMAELISGVSSTEYLYGSLEAAESEVFEKALTSLNEFPLFVEDSRLMSSSTIRSTISAAGYESAAVGVGAIIIDDLPGDILSESAQSDFLAELKALSKLFNCPVTAMWPVKRRVELRNDKRPQWNDLACSYAVQELADYVMTLYRDELYMNSSVVVTGPERLLKLTALRGSNGYEDTTSYVDISKSIVISTFGYTANLADAYKGNLMSENSAYGFEPIEFENDEQYIQWVTANPKCFVLTSNQSLTPRHTVLHRAHCRMITELKGNAKPGGFIRSYIKVGASSLSALRDWAKHRRSDFETRECTKCAHVRPE